MLTNINTYEKFSSHVFVSRETYEKLCVFKKILIKCKNIQNNVNCIDNHPIKKVKACGASLSSLLNRSE